MVDLMCWFSKDYLTPGCQSMQGCVCVCVCVWWVGNQQNVKVSSNRSCRWDLCGCQRTGESTGLLQNAKQHFFLSAKTLPSMWLSFCHTINRTLFIQSLSVLLLNIPFLNFPLTSSQQLNLTRLALHWWKPAGMKVHTPSLGLSHTDISFWQVIMSEL